MKTNGCATLMLGALLLMLSCSRPPQYDDITMITMERGYIHDGGGAEYEVSVGSDGTVRYLGNRGVASRGRRTSTIAQGEFQRLMAKAEEIGFFQLKDDYLHPFLGGEEQPEMFVADGQTVVLTLYRGSDVVKTVSDHETGWDVLGDFEDLIDRVANTEQWIEEPPSPGP